MKKVKTIRKESKGGDKGGKFAKLAKLGRKGKRWLIDWWWYFLLYVICFDLIWLILNWILLVDKNTYKMVKNY